MITRTISTLVLLTLSLTLGSAASASGHTSGYSMVYVFGDSLSDSGNAYTLTGTYSIPPFNKTTAGPFEIGNFRFTNGRTWVEWVAEWIGVRRGGRPAFNKPGRYGNYAVGGSIAGNSANPLYTLGGQIDTFLNDYDDQASASALYIIWIGSNDIRAALNATASDPTLATSLTLIAEGVAGEADGITRLHAAGARHFLILNTPDIGVTPNAIKQGSDTVATATLLSNSYNTGLTEALDGLELTLADIEIQRFDIFALLADIVANAGEYGFSNLASQCIRYGSVEKPYCWKPNIKLFWDRIHPTAKTHRILAREVLEILQPSGS